MTTTKVPLERLTRLNDGLEQLEDLWGDDASDAHSDGEYSDGGRRTYEVQTEDGQWMTIEADDDDEWIEDEDVEMSDGTGESDSDSEMPDLVPLSDSGDQNTVNIQAATSASGSTPTTRSAPIPVPGSWPTAEPATNGDALATSSTPRPPNLTDEGVPPAEDANSPTLSELSSCKRFEILPSAPADHAFISKSMGQPSRQFLGRLNREYKALETSLPGTQLLQCEEAHCY